MRFSEAGIIIEACRAASRYVKVVPNFQGTNGVGKTEGIRQFAESRDMGCITKNLANDEPSDLRGNPLADTASGRTRYLLPEDLPTGNMTLIEILQSLAKTAEVGLMEIFNISAASFQSFIDDGVRRVLGIDDITNVRRGGIRRAHAEIYKELTRDGITPLNRLRAAVALDQDADHDAFLAALVRMQGNFPEGVVHLDELNRALADTKQGAFSLLSEGRIGQYVLPSGWSIVVTENYEEGGDFDVANFKDSAWADRFIYLDWDVDKKFIEDWSLWMSRKYGTSASSVISAVNSDTKIFSVKNGKIPDAKPSPRSWEKVAAFVSIKSKVPGFTDDLFNLILIGLVGSTAATMFRNEALPVTPMEILEDGVKAHKSALDSIATKRGSILGLMAGIIGFARDTISTNKKYQTNCLDFAEWITDCLTSNRDIVIAFLKSIMEASSTGDANGAFRSNLVGHDQVAKILAMGRAKLMGKNRSEDLTDAILARTKLQAAMAILTGKRG